MDRRRLLSPTGTTLEPLEKRVYQRLKKYRSQLENQTLLIGVSGGIDSVVLLHVLVALCTRLQIKIHVVHVNHGIRGKDADNDSRFVAALCKKLKVPCTRKKLRDISSTAGENLLRRMRYEILFALKEKIKATFIVVAHHQDDLLETRLMRLLQGTGIHGLKAMTVLSDERILRPLLDIKRREIEEYAKTKDLAWRNDASNQDTTKLRNWIRRNWLGILRADHPEYVPNLFEGLERLIRNNRDSSYVPSRDFDRAQIMTVKKSGLSENEIDNRIYNYLRQFGKTRVTSRHVSEFKKVLRSKRKQFTFRLAGINWKVERTRVQPF